MAKEDILTRCESALDLISEGIQVLDECSLEGLSGKRYIDVAARLNTQLNSIKKIVEPVKEAIKSRILSDNPGSTDTVFTEKGLSYQARVAKIVKSYLMTEEIKKYLGSALPRFTGTREETHVTFGIRE